MRTSILVTAAIVAFAGPAFAQDRTLPAGSYMAAQPPIDTLSNQRAAFQATALEGRSAAQNRKTSKVRSHRIAD